MTDKKTIDLGGSYRLAVMDERNWKLQHLHVPASNNGRGERAVRQRAHELGLTQSGRRNRIALDRSSRRFWSKGAS